ncbi:MAG: hypothetical protein ABH851_08265 [Methanobacteriota archaeon]
MAQGVFVMGLLIPIIAVLVVALLVVALWQRRKNPGRRPEYKMFFILGIVWLLMGIATDNSAFTILGLIFVIAGATNKDKWGGKEAVK